MDLFKFNLFTTCEGRQKPNKHYVTKSHKIIVNKAAYSDSLGLYWDEIDHHSENILYYIAQYITVSYNNV